jgi:hypothetical protein
VISSHESLIGSYTFACMISVRSNQGRHNRDLQNRYHVDRFRRTFFNEKTKPEVCIFFLSEEAQLCLSRKQICVSARSKFVPFAEEKNTRFFPFFERHYYASLRSKSMLPRELNMCFSRKEKNAFFPFPGGTIVTFAEGNLCLHEK